MMNLDTAIFYTKSITDAVKFYQNVLGFQLEAQNGDRYASFVFSNGAKLGIAKKTEEREMPGAQTAIIRMEGIEDFYKELQANNVPIYKKLSSQAWGKNFAILDPDKNKIEFVERP